MTRAALYSRVSSKAQARDDKVSLGEQFAEMRAYCARKGYEVVARYQDVGSGSTKNRRDFQRLLADACEGTFDVVVCWKSDRLSRGIYPAAALMEVVEAQQIRIESVMDTVDMKTFAIYAAVGKIEIDNLRERTSMGKRGVAKRDKLPKGILPYGYQKGLGGEVQVHPEEGPIVRRIYRDYVEESVGSHTIAQRLLADGIKPRKGSPWSEWSVAHINRILGREEYTGEGWYGRHRVMTTEQGRKRFTQPKETWIRINYPPLIDHAMWERAQALKKERRRRARRNTRAFYLLQGLLKCSECGLGFTARTYRRNRKRVGDTVYEYEFDPPIRYYVCNGKFSHRLDCRERPYLRAEPLETLVWNEVARVLEDPDVIKRGLGGRVEGKTSGDLDREIEQAEKSLERVRSEEDRLIRLFVIKKINESQLDHQRKFITERSEQAQDVLEALSAQRRSGKGRQKLVQGMVTWVEEVRRGLRTITPEDRQKVLRLVLEGIGIDRSGNVRITLAIPGPSSMSGAALIPTCSRL